MKIRKAKSKDAKEIIEVNVKTWITTYKGMIPDRILQIKMDTIEESTKICEETVEKDDNVLVAVEDEKIVGIVSYGKARAINDSTTGEIYSIYVLKEYQGKNIGKKLFKAAKDILNKEGYKNLIVTCIKQNPYNEFYKKMGGKIIKVIKSNIFDVEIEENLIRFE